MARDEALLIGVGAAASTPTLRLYRWDPATISLGYFQKFADFEELAAPAGRLAVVRRTTGGGAILHDLEWTYSLVLPADDPRCSPNPQRLYELVHDALIDALTLLGIRARRCRAPDDSTAHSGPFFCFQRRHCLDVLVGPDKLAGSAQRRTKSAILQHGSIILDNRFAQHPAAAIRRLVDVPHEALIEPFAEALQRRLQSRFEPGEWTTTEQDAAAELRVKYVGDAWTRKF